MYHKYIDKKTFEINNDVFEVDELIAETISILNKKGYKTTFCCSGHCDESIHEIIESNDKLNLERFHETDYNVIFKDDYSIIYFKDPYSRTYIYFDKDYHFKTLPEGFEKQPKSIEEDGVYIESKDEFIGLYKMINLYSDGIRRKTKNVIEEIKLNNKNLLKWANQLEDLNTK